MVCIYMYIYYNKNVYSCLATVLILKYKNFPFNCPLIKFQLDKFLKYDNHTAENQLQF